MLTVGYHASHEQMSPSRLLALTVAAGQAGFAAAMCSDHLAPWSERQGHSGHAWCWLGAALQATRLPFGVVTAPGQRYHPAVVAQAIATLAELNPGRFWAALGSGEALNEHVTGDRWPVKAERDARLLECVEVIRALLAGEEVTHHGHIHVDRARVWTLPAEPPLLYGAAVSERTARTVAGWADGLITVNQPIERLRRVVGAFRDAAGDRQRPVAVQVHLAWAESDDAAAAIAHDQWRNGAFGTELAWNLELPAQFDEAGRWVRPADLDASVVIESDLGRLRDRLGEIAGLGVDALYLHHVGVGPDHDRFIDTFGDRVIPELVG